MGVSKKKIGIITTVSNWELYEETIQFFPRDIKIFAIDGTHGFFGLNSILLFMKRLKKFGLDWLIMADEDVVFTDQDKIFQLIDYLNKRGYVACGMRDGGVLSWRDQNPYLLNTFFTILNLKDIYSIYDEKDVINNQFINKDEFKEDIDFLPYNYHSDSLFEPYYCFFLWLLRKGRKFEYLDGYNPESDETTVVLDHKGNKILYHTWYARLYKKDKIHTARINKVLKEGKLTSPLTKPIVFKDHIFHLKKKWRKLKGRLKNRLVILLD